MRRRDKMKIKRLFMLVMTVLIMSSLILAGCSQAKPEVEDEAVVEASITEEDAEDDSTADTADADPSDGDKVGGTFVRPVSVEPNSLDPAAAGMVTIPGFIGSSLVTINPDGEYVGYLAESWDVSEDGTVYDFHLKENVTFHNGMPLTAADYAFTFSRLYGENAVPGGASALLGPVINAEAVDEYTLRLTLAQPHAPLLFSLSITGFYQPVNQAAFEEMGSEAYGRAPVGVGPYMFKEWAAGDKIVLERNPNFAWGPDFLHQGPYYIETIEFPFINETSTILAALETGEVHYAEVPFADLERFKAMDSYNFYNKMVPAFAPSIQLNVGKAPLDDVNIRKAMNIAVNREALVEISTMGSGFAQYGVLSPSTVGYWSGAEDYAKSMYSYDIEAAKALIAESGYADTDGDGIVEKDGQPLSITLSVTNERTEFVKIAEVLMEQYKQIGIEIVLEQIESNTFSDLAAQGEYQAATIFMNYPEADILYISFHSGMAGITNVSFTNDADLDALLDETRNATTQDSRNQAIIGAQKLILDQSYVIPLYTTISTYAMSSSIEGFLWADSISGLQAGYLNDAYFVK